MFIILLSNDHNEQQAISLSEWKVIYNYTPSGVEFDSIEIKITELQMMKVHISYNFYLLILFESFLRFKVTNYANKHY